MNDTNKNHIQLLWQNKYHECLSLEFSNPEYFAVHHLLVITYMIQSDGYSEAYFPKAVQLLKRFVQETISPPEFLSEFNSAKENKNIENLSDVRDIGKFNWRLDIMSVRTETSEFYCNDIKLWAKDVLGVIHTN